MNVNVITLTYGDRFHLLGPVLDALGHKTEINKVIVVCNGVTEFSMIGLHEKIRECSKIVLLDMGYNAGSAKGYKQGILKSLKYPAKYLWLLDDDNLPEDQALSLLLEKHKELSQNYRGKPFSLLSYRPDRPYYQKAVETRQPFSVIGPNNSFLGFHLAEKSSKLVKKLFFAKPESKWNDRYGRVAVAPYGGMFFSKELIEQIGYPNEVFFLYGDDYDFSYRITRGGGAIICVLDSQLTDLEKSFHLKSGKLKRGLNTRYFKTENRNTIYYSVRNGIVFEQNFIKNQAIYFLNKSFYIILLGLVMLTKPKHIWKYFIVLGAIKDAKNVQLNN
jgi:GT2 family glycosyltransferase